MAGPACNSSAQEAETEQLLVLGQHELHNKTIYHKTRQSKTKEALCVGRLEIAT